VQVLDETKRLKILDVAARLFATEPFHVVTLDKIAAEAKIGKGTVYVYFKSKDDLFVSLILEATESLLDEIKGESSTQSSPLNAWAEIKRIVDVLFEFWHRHPYLCSLMRDGVDLKDPRMEEKRAEISNLCTQVIRRGVRSGELKDPHPELTGQYILALVRLSMLHSTPGVSDRVLRNHILRILGNGLFAAHTPGEGKS